MKSLGQLWLVCAYFFSWVLFALGGLALNLASIPLLLCKNREHHGARARATTRWLFAFWVRWLHAANVIRITWTGFDRPLPSGVIYAANHPGIMDAPLLLSRLPDTVCIFKPALLRNPVVAPTALLCGFVSAGDNGLDLIRNAVDRVNAGQSLLIFPEGTRTVPGSALNPLKAGFAVIASRAGRPVQLIRVRTTAGLGAKNQPWWRLPALPGHVEFILDELIPPSEIDSPLAFTERVATHLRVRLAPVSIRQ